MGGLEALAVAQSYHNWWQLAGVDTLVGEAPADWLAKAAPKVRPSTDPAPQTPPQVADGSAHGRSAPDPRPLSPPAEMPDEWGVFQNWLANDPDVPGTQWDKHRLLPVGEAGASLMILSACPEIEEQGARELFAGLPGQLLDAMLRAIGLKRNQCYISALAMTRPPGGRMDSAARDALTPLLWHHLALARPQRLLLLGNDITAMVTQSDVASMRGDLREINQDGATVSAAAILHPALLLARPALKAAAWDSLKRFQRGR